MKKWYVNHLDSTSIVPPSQPKGGSIGAALYIIWFYTFKWNICIWTDNDVMVKFSLNTVEPELSWIANHTNLKTTTGSFGLVTSKTKITTTTLVNIRFVQAE